MAALRLAGVSKRFGRHPAVADLDLVLAEQEILGLLGPSGCGKTTLLRLIAGLVQPDGGTIEIGGQVVAGPCFVPPERRGVGMVFQDYALFPHLTVLQNVAFGLRYGRGCTRDRLRERVATVLALVGLEGFERRYPHELSGGQRQRVALARAIAPEPALILLDEPLSNLDVQLRQRLRGELRDILKRAGMAAILVTHDREEALCLGDRVAVMHNGRLEQCDTPEVLYRQPATPFVAEFVCQANLVPACRGPHCGQDIWETPVGRFALGDRLLAGNLLPLRPEEIILQPDEGSHLAIAEREFLGGEFLYRLRGHDGCELAVRSRQVWSTGQRMRVILEKSSL